MLFGIGPLDPATHVAVIGILLTATALASHCRFGARRRWIR
jgi:hypothetical protein